MKHRSNTSIIRNDDSETWDDIINSDRSLFDIRLGEIWKHRDLLYMFVWRDFVMVYKQTILGPLWIFLQPVLIMSVYIVVFSRFVKIPTDGVHPAVFYLAGIIVWNYFTHCLNKTANTFAQNASIFGKVYFPRLIIPISKILSGLINLFIQIVLFSLVIIYFTYYGDAIHVNMYLFLVPYLLLLTGCLGLGIGLITSALTTTYRDLVFLVSFGVQLLMFASAVIYPVSIIPVNYRSIILWNPLIPVLETFRYAFFGVGEHAVTGIIYASMITFMILFAGLILFNRIEQTFIDTV